MSSLSKKLIRSRISAFALIALSLNTLVLVPASPAQAVAPSGSIYFNQASIKHAYDQILDVGEVVGGKTESFTVEMWIKPTYTGSCAAGGTVNATNGLCAEGLWASGFEAPGDVNIGSDRRSSGCTDETQILVIRNSQWCSGTSGANTFPSINTWSHIAWSVDSIGKFSLYINGVRKMYDTYSIDMSLRGLNRYLYIGKGDRAAFTGYMTNVRLVKGAALYTGATITVPTQELTTTAPNGTTQFLLQARDFSSVLNDSTANTMNFSPDGSYVLADISPASTPIGGVTWSSDSPFTPPPTITSLSVATGITAGGTSTVITGTNLSSASSVTVGGSAASIVSNTSTAITITTPVGTDGAKNVVVTTAGGTTTRVGGFTYFSKFAVIYEGGVGTTGTAPVQASIGPNETFTVAAGTSILKTGYTFSKWKDSGNVEYLTGATYTVTNAPVTLTAQWTIKNYAVSFAAGAHGSISGTTPQNVDHGSSSSQVTAVPDSNYHFVSWSDASTINPRTITSVETTTSLTASFAIDTYTASYTSGGNGTISGTAIQTINHGESATAVTAVASANYHFSAWSDGVVTAERRDTGLTASITKTALFSIDSHAVTFNANGGTGGAAVLVNYNENALTVAPTVTRSQYFFAGWAETVTASNIASWTVIGPKTLYSLWTPKVYTISYSPESGTATTSSETYTVGTAPIHLQGATRAGYKFNGWYTSRSGGTVVGGMGALFTPTDTATVYAQWTQASLVGLTSPTSFGTIIATNGNDGGISATRSGTKAEVDYFADSLPDGTVVTAYLQGSTVYAASQLAGVSNLLLSVVVAWKAPDESVPLVDPTKNAIRLKITNPDIKAGAKVYSIMGDTSTVLTTATQDGFVVIELREDPEIVIANPVVVPAPTIVVAPTPAPVVVVTPQIDTAAIEAELKAKQEAEAKSAAELKAALEKAARELKEARDKAEAELKAAQEKADTDARLKAEADAKVAAELKAIEDAAIAAALAQKKIVPDVTLYSISSSLKLSTYDLAYLKKYVSTLKPKSTVTCIGYIYSKNTSVAAAKSKASNQATAICSMIKAQKKTITTKVLLYPSWKAPKAAAGAKWVAVSYRVDGFKS
jgi:uncharacterized repeat protein (TIGR02543 family)